MSNSTAYLTTPVLSVVLICPVLVFSNFFFFLKSWIFIKTRYILFWLSLCRSAHTSWNFWMFCIYSLNVPLLFANVISPNGTSFYWPTLQLFPCMILGNIVQLRGFSWRRLKLHSTNLFRSHPLETNILPLFHL